MTEVGGEVGSVVLPYLVDQVHSEAPGWLVLGIGVVLAGLLVWAWLRRGVRGEAEGAHDRAHGRHGA